MFFSIQPLQFLLTLLAGWINRRQLEAIDYLIEENRLLAHAVPDHGSRYEIFCGLPRGIDSRAHRVDPTAAAITKFERVCGEIRTLGEDGVYRADGLLQQIIA